MTTRYEYDLDHNGHWRWIATADDAIVVSPEGYTHLQDCLHAIALMQDAGEVVLRGGVDEVHAPNPPEGTLARLEMRLHSPS
jgi:uncharacterized protein YegP (UPF0339 family)